MTMKIGLITGEYPPMQGGVGAFTRELALALRDLGQEVHIITHRLARPQSDSRNWGDLLEPMTHDAGWLHPVARRWGWGDIGRVADIAVRHELDVLNIQYQAAAYNMKMPAINLSPRRLKGIATIIPTFHDLRVPYLFPKAGKWRKWIVERLAHDAHGIILTNEDDLNALQGRRVRTPAVSIPIGSNITTYQPAETEVAQLRQALGLSAEDCLLGYFGFVNPSKGADSLIRLLADCPENTHLVFIGGQTGASDAGTNQAFLNQIKRQVFELGLTQRVHWSGFLPDAQVSTYLHACDIMVMPYRDGISLRRGTLMAILAHGRPLISTESDREVPALKHGENCWLVPRGNQQSLLWAVGFLRENAGIRQKLSRGATQLSDQFTWDKIAQQTLDFYQKIIDFPKKR
jgi:glycosyltransferase involved in cell wall biosynthesis